MKKYLLAAALVLASASAMADREDSGSVECRGEKGCRVENGTGGGNDMAEACKAAKFNIFKQIQGTEHAAKYSSCKNNCNPDKKGHWACNIDATIVDN